MNMKKDKEIKWVVPQYEGITFHNYLISSEGVLVSKNSKGKKTKPIFDDYSIVKPIRSGAGYIYHYPVDSKGKKRVLIGTHRLMWSSFVCPISDGMVIDHINEDKLDNRLVNLQMITHSENLKKHYELKKKPK